MLHLKDAKCELLIFPYKLGALNSNFYELGVCKAREMSCMGARESLMEKVTLPRAHTDTRVPPRYSVEALPFLTVSCCLTALFSYKN